MTPTTHPPKPTPKIYRRGVLCTYSGQPTTHEFFRRARGGDLWACVECGAVRMETVWVGRDQ